MMICDKYLDIILQLGINSWFKFHDHCLMKREVAGGLSIYGGQRERRSSHSI